MLFKYTHEMNEDTAKNVAKFSRANLVRALIAQYHALEKINQPEPDWQVTRTLRGILTEIESINTCSNTTTATQEYLQARIDNMQDHPQYVEIKAILGHCIAELKKESNLAKDRARDMTKNQITAIKNKAVYLGAGPATIAVAGSILAVFSPLGWMAFGIGVGMLILGELSFLLYHRATLQQLNTKLEQDDLDADYGTGLAIPDEELPQIPKEPRSTSKEPVFSDQVVEELGDLLADTRHVVVNSATSVLSHAQAYVPVTKLYTIWSTVSTIMAKEMENQPNNSNIDHFHFL